MPGRSVSRRGQLLGMCSRPRAVGGRIRRSRVLVLHDDTRLILRLMMLLMLLMLMMEMLLLLKHVLTLLMLILPLLKELLLLELLEVQLLLLLRSLNPVATVLRTCQRLRKVVVELD